MKTLMFARLFFVMCSIAALSSCDHDKPEPLDRTPPEAPTDLNVVEVGDTYATLSWEGATLEYELYVGGMPRVADSKSYTITGLTPGTQYEWKVRARMDGYESEWAVGDPFTTDGGDSPHDRVIISNVEDLPTQAASIKALVWYYVNEAGKELEVSSANIVNGTATLELPETIGDQYLVPFRDIVPSGIELSDTDTKFASVYFMVFDSSGRVMGDVYFETEMVYTDLLYVDRACTITGTHIYESAGYSETYDLNMVAGFNWTQNSDTENSLTVENGTPSDGSWVYYPLPF